MKSFQDVNNFQKFLPEDDNVWQGDLLSFRCQSKEQSWQAPSVYIPRPTLRRGHFLDLCPGAFAIDSSATDELRDLLEMSGELLPLEHKGETFTVINVTGCYNALN